MYAKLVTGNANLHFVGVLRDIGRLLTSNTPSTADLLYLSNTSSIIYDNTPAGWTYVGSNDANDQPTISTSTDANPTKASNYVLVFSAPCANTSKTKYCVLGSYSANNNANNVFSMATCSTADSSGVMTNKTPMANTVSGTAGTFNAQGIRTTSGEVFYLIANPRHVTLCIEGKGICAVWEHSESSVHQFYNTAPVVMYWAPNYPASDTRSTVTADASTLEFGAWTIDITDPGSGVNYGVFNVATGTAISRIYNQNHFFPQTNNVSYESRPMTIDSSGNPRYQIDPIWFRLGEVGYPSSFVTGIVPIYWTKSQIGTTGDTVDVDGSDHTFFNTGTGFGVVIDVNATG